MRHLYLHSPIARNKDLNVKFVNLMDSLGQKRDTIVRLTHAEQREGGKRKMV
jgi:hypothetical protein